MSRPRTFHPRILQAALVMVVFCSCQAEDPLDPAGSGPGFEAQVEAMAPQLDAWDAWFEELARLDQADRFGEVLFHRQKTQRLLWDQTSAKRLSDTTVLEDPGACCGPLLTLVDLKHQLDQLSVDMLVVFVPLAAAVYPEHFGQSAPLADGQLPPLLDGRLRRFYAALEAAGVEVLDLLPTFLERRYDGPIDPADGRRELLFRWQDPHWTTYGSSVAAAQIAQRVRRYSWFEDIAVQQGEALLEEVVSRKERHGYIAQRMLGRGLLPAETPKERVRQVQVRIPGEIWSFNDRASPIVLLGDSFASRAHGLPDQLLKQLGFRVDAITVPGGEPTGAVKALRFRGDRLAGKRLVIWEITVYALNGDWRPVEILGVDEAD